MVQSLKNLHLRHGLLSRRKFAGKDVSHNVAKTKWCKHCQIDKMNQVFAIIVLWPDVKWNNKISCIYFKRRIFTISLVPWVRSRSPSCAGKPCRDLLTSTPCTRPGLSNLSTKYTQLVSPSSSYLWEIIPPLFFAGCTGILRGQTSSSQKTRMWNWRILACLRR